uniref:Zinc finger translocation associated n=1 Tax=Pseudonaja textilis TaxID=8673 RepID=A0A670YTD3_PSETE
DSTCPDSQHSGESRRKYSDHCEARASRPGKSRIPGRDHRRYYHEHWRAEYLMDFNAARHGMICMVCGSSLATLKLSTIKRHIRQKHAYSLTWSTQEKEVIMNSWDAHLGLEMETEGAREAAKGSGAPPRDHGRMGIFRDRILDSGGWVALVLSSRRGESQSLEQYLKQSLQSWFQSEFLMDYDPQGNRLFCMMCGSSLPSLNLDDIKRHVMEAHPTSLGFTPAEKGAILEAWNSRELVLGAEARNEEDAGETDMAGLRETGMSAQQDLSTKELDSSTSPDRPPAEEGMDEAGPWDSEGSSPRVPARGRDHRRYFQEHWRVEYLMDYNGLRHGLVCMVCGSTLATLKMSTIKRHIQQKHPDSTQLSHHVKALIVQEWNQKVARLTDADDSHLPILKHADGGGLWELKSIYLEADSWGILGIEREEEAPGAERLALPQPSSPGVASTPAGALSRRSQRRNYQPRWRVQYLMDYDEQKHGLICMVCGGTLATLKVSTIKRHILQVHRFSLEYTELEKQTILEAYSENERIARRDRATGPKTPAAGINSETRDIKPGTKEAGKMALGYKLSLCAV